MNVPRPVRKHHKAPSLPSIADARAETNRRNQDFHVSHQSSVFIKLCVAVIAMWWDGRFGPLLTHGGVQPDPIEE